MPTGPKEDATRRESDASTTSTSSTSSSSSGGYSPDRRRSSAVNRFDTFKRPTDAEHAARRASWQDSYAKPGFFGSMWNAYVRGPTVPATGSNAKVPAKESRDITTLRSE